MTRRLVVCLCLALAAALPASAGAGPKEDIAEATRLLENVEEEKAVPVLLKAVENLGASPSERAELWGLLGVARFNLRDVAGARDAFRKALDANPALSSSKLLAPKGRALVEEVRAQREEELKAKASQPVPAKPVVVARPAEGPPFSTKGILGLGAGGGGVVALAIGAGLAANAGSLRSQAVGEADAMKADQLFRSGRSQRAAGIGLLSAGTALVAAGVALFFWPESKSSTTVLVAPTGVAVAGRF
ncbi:MAG TPA: tetratricopeptide repeat protein [Myxococcales bacterium]|jgi:hypothetical protein